MKNPKKSYDEKINIMTLGNSQVGKTSFILRYTEDSFKINYLSTLGIDFISKIIQMQNGLSYKINFYDTAGQEKYKSMSLNVIKNADGILLLYDISQQVTFDSISQWMEDIKNLKEEEFPILLVGNKCDLTEKRVISKEEGEKLANQYGISFFETSCKDGINIKDAVLELTNQIIKKNKNNFLDDFEIINNSDIIKLDDYKINRNKKQNCQCSKDSK